MMPSRPRLSVAALLTLVARISAQANATLPTEPSDFFPQLANLEGQRPTGNPNIGGQNFTWCCLLAVQEALDVVDGRLVLLDNDTILVSDASELEDYAKRGQFPCGAVYNGDRRGAPIVQVNYTWLADVCPGWALSSRENLNAWLQPLSGFLLPAVIFCLSVPRRRKIHVWRVFFVADLAGVKSYIPALFGGVCALAFVTLDTIVWLSTCFAFAGPMMLSGLYEALLDNRIIEFLRIKIEKGERLTLDMRCRLLMIVLIGNLDLALDEPEMDDEEPQPAQTQRPQGNNGYLAVPGRIISGVLGRRARQSHSDGLGEPRSSIELQGARSSQERPSHTNSANTDAANTRSSLDQPEGLAQSVGQPATESISPAQPLLAAPPEPSRSETSQTARPLSIHSVVRRKTHHLRASPWRHMEELLYDIRLYGEEDGTGMNLSPRQWPRHTCSVGYGCRNKDHLERPLPRTPEVERKIAKTKTRLRTMLHCQYSFGSVIGAPVVFFLGGFIFALLQSMEGLGDEDIAEGLAFGQWYMTIPHIAIISGLLLAGNNPNILEGVFATERDDEGDSYRILFLDYGLAYPSCYKVAWQWLRGHTKRLWIDKVISTYETRRDEKFSGDAQPDHDMEDLRAMTTLSPTDWLLIICITTLLLGVPFVLAFLTAFYTPEVGLSCRSLTFTIYASVQAAQILLWLWAYAGPLAPRDDDQGGLYPLNVFRRGGWLDRTGFYHPNDMEWLLGPDLRNVSVSMLWKLVRSKRFWSLRTFWCLLYSACEVVFGTIAVTTALGGTIMQLMGVYTADVCMVTVDYWFAPYASRPKAVISKNSGDMISFATDYWLPCAITAIVFMTVVSFVGWWYQRRMRDIFTNLVKKIDNERWEREDTKASRRPAPLPPVASGAIVDHAAPVPASSASARDSTHSLVYSVAHASLRRRGGENTQVDEPVASGALVSRPPSLGLPQGDEGGVL